MRDKGVSLSKKGQEDAAIEWFDKALGVNPKDAASMRNRGVSLIYTGAIDSALEWIGNAVRLSPDRWEQDFRAACKLAEKNTDDEWRRLFQDGTAVLPATQDPFGELRLIITTIRERLKDQSAAYLKMKRQEETRLAEFLQPKTRLAKERSLFMVLRKWNSYTPALPASADDERSRGGGYFLWHQGHGTVIDPGFNFTENFH